MPNKSDKYTLIVCNIIYIYIKISLTIQNYSLSNAKSYGEKFVWFNQKSNSIL